MRTRDGYWIVSFITLGSRIGVIKNVDDSKSHQMGCMIESSSNGEPVIEYSSNGEPVFHDLRPLFFRYQDYKPPEYAKT